MKNWESILGAGSILLLFVTIVLLIINYKEGRYYFLALAFYLAQIVFLNLLSAEFITISPISRYYVGIWNNLLDLPLMLIFFQYFAKDAKTRKLLVYITGIFIAFDLVTYLSLGMNITSLTIMIGPGLLIVTAFSFYFFVEHLKTAIMKRKETGRAFLSGAIVFAYLCFTLIYILFYLMKSKYVNDIYTIYYTTFIIFSTCLITGLLMIMASKRPSKSKVMETKKEIGKEDENAFQFL
jgi:hypothetical protein